MQELVDGRDPYAEYQRSIDALMQAHVGALPYRPDVFDDEMWNLCCKTWRKLPEKRPPMDIVLKELIRIEKYANFLSR
jgi:hypothetical protein